MLKHRQVAVRPRRLYEQLGHIAKVDSLFSLIPMPVSMRFVSVFESILFQIVITTSIP